MRRRFSSSLAWVFAAPIVLLHAATAAPGPGLRAQGQGGESAATASRERVEPDVTTLQTAEGLTLAVFVTPYLGAEAIADVLVGVELSGLASPFPSEPDLARPVEIAYSLTGPAARPVAATMAVPASATRPGGDHTALALFEVPRPAGRYELRVTAREPATGRTVAARHAFDVPDAEPPPVSLRSSGLTLAASGGPGVAAGNASDERRVLPILHQPPSPRRRFGRDEQVEVFAELYDWLSLPGEEYQMTLVTSVSTAQGVEVYRTEEIGQSEPLTNGRFGYAHSTLVPVADLDPGSYVVTVSARWLTGLRESVSRSVPITVAPSGPVGSILSGQ